MFPYPRRRSNRTTTTENVNDRITIKWCGRPICTIVIKDGKRRPVEAMSHVMIGSDHSVF